MLRDISQLSIHLKGPGGGIRHIKTPALELDLLGVVAESAQLFPYLLWIGRSLTTLVPDPLPRCGAGSGSWTGLRVIDGEPPFSQVGRGFSCVVVDPGSIVQKTLSLAGGGVWNRTPLSLSTLLIPAYSLLFSTISVG